MTLLGNVKTIFGAGDTPTKVELAETKKQAKGEGTPPVVAKPTDIVIGGDGTWNKIDGSPVVAHAFPFLRKFEPRHVLITGTTGAGKSQLFYNIFDQVRDRGDKAIIVDHGGENLARYYRPGDIVLNPFDDRFPGWNPMNEIREDFDHDNMARFVVPDGHGDNASWAGYGQDIYSSVSRVCEAEGASTIKNMVRMMLRADPKILREKLEDEPAGALFLEGSEKMAANARSILGAHLKSWRYIKEGSFSLRNWVENDDDKRWVFISYKESNFAALRGFISMMVSIAINYTMDLAPSNTRRIWFSLDEMATLGKISTLADGLTKLRKYGGCVVSGLQAASQLVESYGKEGATTLLANYNTWVALRPGDADTAELFSKHFGKQEVLRRSTNDGGNQGSGGAGQSESITTAWHEQYVQTYTELMMLDDLHAVVKFPGNIKVGFMKIPYSPRVEKAAPYIPINKA
jgi:type IV secretory pathway TraG/TraD family ATPase VirD4